MNTPRFAATLLLAAVVAAALGGCAASPAPDEARSPVALIDRAGAIASAREDASHRYGDSGGPAQAQYRGGYWVVELHATGGTLLRYAISARDGSIRERSMVQ